MLTQDAIYMQMIDRLSAKFRTRKPVTAQKAEPLLWQPDEENLPQCAAFASPADVLGYGGAAGCGKALALETLLPDPGGWTTMRDVRVGDPLLDDQGRVCSVIAVSPVFYKHQCYEVIFDDGERIVADADHKWKTLDATEREQCRRRTAKFRAMRRVSRAKRGAGKRPDLAHKNAMREFVLLPPPSGSIRTTAEIAKSLRTSSGRVNHSIPLGAPLDLPRNPYLSEWVEALPIRPYTLGAWLGDGRTKQGKIYVDPSDNLIVTRIRVDGYKVRGVPSEPLGWTILGLQPLLRRIGVLGNKHIPTVFLRAPFQQRLELMAGLMDTDGTCNERGRAEFTTTKKILAEGVLELARTLGIKASMIEGRATLRGKDCGPKYRVCMTTSVPLFSLTRKLRRQRTAVRATQGQRYITACRLVKSVPVKCVAVNSPSRMYLAGAGMVPTHNSDLEIGLGVSQHEKTVIFRREATQIRDMIARSRDIIGVNGHLNENIGLWRDILGHRSIEFAGVKQKEDWRKQQGRARDLYCFDEATEFTEEQFRALITWNRTSIPGQRCRVVACFNPPQDDEGRWVIRYWGPWLDPHHPRPAKPGELRWYAMVDGKEVEVADGTPFEHKNERSGQMERIEPLSRTFIPGRVTDNKYLMATNYVARLQSLREPMRSQYLYGDFSAGIVDDPYQLIPTAWVYAAQNRWRDAGGDAFVPEVILTSAGVDVAEGGRDQTIFALRFGNYFPSLKKYQGHETPDGGSVATLLQRHLADHLDYYINMDALPSAALNYCRDADLPVAGVNNSAAAPKWARDKSEKFKFKNIRAWHYWLLYEALDPEQGENLMLPDDPELRADLIAPRYKITAQGIQVESKDDIKERLGRSPDCGDAVVLAHAPFADDDSAVWIAV